ncbi:MAG: hypothetical protein V4580_06615 [Bacteroidota bacterium]
MILIVFVWHTSSTLCSQVSIGRPWRAQLGVSTSSYFTESFAYNLRYISPKFNWSDDDLIEDNIKQAE